MYVPVVDSNQIPLMPTIPSRARRWVKEGKATPFWKKGVFCVRLNVRPSSEEKQPIAVGIDPGSKKEGFSVKSAFHTYLNIQADAVIWVSRAVEQRRELRRFRRSRKTPCRTPRKNRSRGSLPPSTKARWQWKLRLTEWLARLYPVTVFVVEDIKARTKGQRRWDQNFSPLEVGKNWFYQELSKLAPVTTKQGWETKELRDSFGLPKASRKLAEVFEAHCVDSWVLANWSVGGHAKPDNTELMCVTPVRLHRRQLHAMKPAKSGVRRPYGGTRSLGFKRGSLVKNSKRRLVYVGGVMGGRISLLSIDTGKRVSRRTNPKDCKFLSYSSWRILG